MSAKDALLGRMRAPAALVRSIHRPQRLVAYGAVPSREVRYVFSYLLHRGGCVRIRPLLRFAGLERTALLDALAELHERYWVVFNRSEPSPGAAYDPEAEILRVTITRFGRRKYRAACAGR